jgi:hypothetical protein
LLVKRVCLSAHILKSACCMIIYPQMLRKPICYSATLEIIKNGYRSTP